MLLYYASVDQPDKCEEAKEAAKKFMEEYQRYADSDQSGLMPMVNDALYDNCQKAAFILKNVRNVLANIADVKERMKALSRDFAILDAMLFGEDRQLLYSLGKQADQIGSGL